MRTGIFGAVALLLLHGTGATAQAPAPAAAVLSEPFGTSPDALPPVPDAATADGRESPVWVQSDYLLFWIKDGPAPVPLATTSSAGDFGTVGAASTRVLFGGTPLDFGTFSGLRLRLGGWLDAEQRLGLEGGGFLLERRSVHFLAQTDAGGTPLLAIPVFDPRTSGQGIVFQHQPAGFPLPGEAGLFLTQPGTFAGGLAVAAFTRLWGAEANGLVNVWRGDRWRVRLLGGFRYLDLSESLDVQSTSLGLAGSGSFAGSSFHTEDRFEMRNQFYGGQLGARATWTRGRLSADFLGKLALGSTHEVVNRGGVTQVANSTDPALPSGTYPTGLLVAGTNAGRRSQDVLTAVPEVQVQVGYELGRHVRVLAGYDFLYASRVARPGDQVDRVVNPTQLPAFGGFALLGPARPAPVFNQTDFWAQGINFGLELRY